jgi:hypothetical protein
MGRAALGAILRDDWLQRASASCRAERHGKSDDAEGVVRLVSSIRLLS